MMIFRRVTSFLLVSIFISPTFAQTSANYKNNTKPLSVKELVLPSETKDILKRSGSIYYNQSVKGKVLVPVNYWGEVTMSGLHYLPAETNFVSGLSMAGGPSSISKLDNIKLIRKNSGKITIKEFDLSEGGDAEAYAYELKPHDTIFVEKSTYFENRAYYTTLVSVFVSLVSGIVIYNQTRK